MIEHERIIWEERAAIRESVYNQGATGGLWSSAVEQFQTMEPCLDCLDDIKVRMKNDSAVYWVIHQKKQRQMQQQQWIFCWNLEGEPQPGLSGESHHVSLTGSNSE